MSKGWYSQPRDITCMDGSKVKEHHLVFETTEKRTAELVEKFFQFVMDNVKEEEKEAKEQQKVIHCRECEYAHITNDKRHCKFCDQFTDDYGELVEMYFDSDFFCGFAKAKEVPK